MTTAPQSPIARLTARQGSIRSLLARTTALDVWAFVVPATSFVQARIIGELILSEVLALLLLPWLLRSRDRLRAPKSLLVLLGAWLVSQIASDLIVRSAVRDWTRGWAAIGFTLIDLLAFLTLASTAARARIVAFGLAAGGVLGVLIDPTSFELSDPWKYAIGGAIGLVLAAGLSGASAARRPWVAIAIFGSFGMVNAAIFGFRSMSGVALLTAAYLILATVLRHRKPLGQRFPARIAVGVGFYGIAALVIYLGLSAAAAANVFGDAARAKFDAQAGIVVPSGPPQASNSQAPAVSQVPSATTVPAASIAPANPLGVLAGGRAELLASTQAILDSPILGHGSWARDPKYVQLQRQRLIDLGIPGGNLPADPDLIPTHSYLLGSWVWAGLAGGLFWGAVAVLVLWMLANVYWSGLELNPLIAFVASTLLWSIAFSPYSNTERLYATFGIVVCLLALRLIRSQDQPGRWSVEPASA